MISDDFFPQNTTSISFDVFSWQLEDLCDPEYYKKVASGGGDNIRPDGFNAASSVPLREKDHSPSAR